MAGVTRGTGVSQPGSQGWPIATRAGRQNEGSQGGSGGSRGASQGGQTRTQSGSRSGNTVASANEGQSGSGQASQAGSHSGSRGKTQVVSQSGNQREIVSASQGGSQRASQTQRTHVINQVGSQGGSKSGSQSGSVHGSEGSGQDNNLDISQFSRRLSQVRYSQALLAPSSSSEARASSASGSQWRPMSSKEALKISHHRGRNLHMATALADIDKLCPARQSQLNFWVTSWIHSRLLGTFVPCMHCKRGWWWRATGGWSCIFGHFIHDRSLILGHFFISLPGPWEGRYPNMGFGLPGQWGYVPPTPGR